MVERTGLICHFSFRSSLLIISIIFLVVFVIFYWQVEIKEKGKLIVDGGQAYQPGHNYELGGGGGGIIQIIAPQGSLAHGTLSLKFGLTNGRCGDGAKNGHFLLKGNYTPISKLGRRAYAW